MNLNNFVEIFEFSTRFLGNHQKIKWKEGFTSHLCLFDQNHEFYKIAFYRKANMMKANQSIN